jgi:phosphoribosyl-AMP cyclohydrolase
MTVQEPDNISGEPSAQASSVSQVTFDSRGLVPCIVQEWNTGEVLMLAYMNEESLGKTLETGTTWFFSRSRGKLWNKGETSGNVQTVRELRYDCDGDTLLAIVEQRGPACHTGTTSCFDDRWLSSPASVPPAFLARRER